MPRELLLLCAALLLTACGSSEQGPATATRPAPAVHDGTGDAQPDVISSSPAPTDEAGSWQRFNVEGVFLEIPTGDDWVVQVHVDPCSSRLERFFLLENRETLDRIKVDLATKAVDTTGFGDEARLDAVVSRIQGSFSGIRQLPEILEKRLPFPTTTACDPKATDDIPTLTPGFVAPSDPPATVAPEPTITPVTPPVPPPVPVQ